MDRRGFVLLAVTTPLTLCLKDLIVKDNVCYLQIRQGKVEAKFNGEKFKPKIEEERGRVVILDDLPSIVHIDMESLKN